MSLEQQREEEIVKEIKNRVNLCDYYGNFMNRVVNNGGLCRRKGIDIFILVDQLGFNQGRGILVID